jgi:hypothetical protein
MLVVAVGRVRGPPRAAQVEHHHRVPGRERGGPRRPRVPVSPTPCSSTTAGPLPCGPGGHADNVRAACSRTLPRTQRPRC